MAVRVIKCIILSAIALNLIEICVAKKEFDYISYMQCVAHCISPMKYPSECKAECKISTSKKKFAVCPAMEDIESGFDLENMLRNNTSTCTEKKNDCPNDETCCKVGIRSWGCVNVTVEYRRIEHLLPTKPHYVKLTEEDGVGVLEFAVFVNFLNLTTVFSVEAHSTVGPEYNASAFDDFRQVYYARRGFTNSNGTETIRCDTKIRPGRYYQYRIAAINMHGSRGYVTSNVFKLSKGKSFYRNFQFSEAN